MRRASIACVVFTAILSGCAVQAERALADVPVPPGGTRVHADATGKWEALMDPGPRPRASATYHYANDTDPRALLLAARALVEEAGWSSSEPSFDEAEIDPGETVSGQFRATTDDWRLAVRVGRWEASPGECCIATNDSMRPIGLHRSLTPI